ncbi:hypothetical protein IAR50_002053 [Cryptococcus sp. DSM 104548]
MMYYVGCQYPDQTHQGIDGGMARAGRIVRSHTATYVSEHSPALLLSTLAFSALATLTITEPSVVHWYMWGVGNSANTLAWDGTDPAEFSVFLANPDVKVLTSMLALASIVPTYQTSLTMNPGDATAATGYTILITNPLNSSDEYNHALLSEGSYADLKEDSFYPPQGVAVNASATAEGTVAKLVQA